MRSIFTHTINPANEAIRVDALDGPGPGGASHEYRVALPDGDEVLLQFQNGPVLANGEGVNGLTHEALLAIVLDRMHAFQKGPYACRENALVVTKLEEAMHWLHHRTKEREMRGVEGTHAQ